jgi:CubicO group peptidase (beta-lactamase class C family)
VITGDHVDHFVVDNPGSNYINPPKIIFTGGTSPARAQAVIKDGKVVAIRILNGGSGYQQIPQASISGGNRGPKARSATLGKVFISNGTVYYVEVTDGGKGYVDPLTVLVEPGAPAANNIPIWAPAGALWSTTRDMIELAQVALGDKYVGWRKIDKHLIQGFQIAEKPYACSTPGQDPWIDSSGLAWAISRADGGLPQVISKNGGIKGASTEIRLVPSEGFAVVVLSNSRQNFTSTNGGSGQPTAIAGNISDNIVAAIVRHGLSHGKGWGDHH